MAVTNKHRAAVAHCRSELSVVGDQIEVVHPAGGNVAECAGGAVAVAARLAKELKNATIVTLEPGLGDVEGDILVDGDRIAEIRKGISAPNAEVVDGNPGRADALGEGGGR